MRRYDLDWLRILVISLLILTHVLYGYGANSQYRFVSTNQGAWADLLRMTMQPWRMALIFFIAGAAARFMLDKLQPGAFVQNRMLRLLVPFLFGVVVLVPICQYLTSAGVPGSGFPEPILDFLLTKTLRAQQVYGVPVPEFVHVWFLLYVFVYAALAGLAWRYAPQTVAAFGRWVQSLPVWVVLGGLMAVFVLADGILEPRFGRSDLFVNDPAGHLRSLTPFVLGLLLARPSEFWKRLRGSVIWLAPAGVIAFAGSVGIQALPLLRPGEVIPHISFYLGAVHGTYGAVMVLLILSLASRLLNRPAPSYFSDAIMPVYLLHEPVMIGVGVLIVGLRLPLGVELPVIYLASMLIPLAIYHFAIRPWPPARFLFGMKMHAPEAKPVTTPPASTTLSPTA